MGITTTTVLLQCTMNSVPSHQMIGAFGRINTEHIKLFHVAPNIPGILIIYEYNSSSIQYKGHHFPVVRLTTVCTRGKRKPSPPAQQLQAYNACSMLIRYSSEYHPTRLTPTKKDTLIHITLTHMHGWVQLR